MTRKFQKYWKVFLEIKKNKTCKISTKSTSKCLEKYVKTQTIILASIWNCVSYCHTNWAHHVVCNINDLLYESGNIYSDKIFLNECIISNPCFYNFMGWNEQYFEKFRHTKMWLPMELYLIPSEDDDFWWQTI